MNEIIDLLNNYQTYIKDIYYSTSTPIEFYMNEAKQKYNYKMAQVGLIIIPLGYFLFALYMQFIYSNDFNLKECLIQVIAIPLGLFILIRISFVLFAPNVVLELNNKILEVSGIPLDFDEVVEITFYEEGSRFFKKIFMQVKYLRKELKKSNTIELDITHLSNKRTLILLLKSTFEDKVKYKK